MEGGGAEGAEDAKAESRRNSVESAATEAKRKKQAELAAKHNISELVARVTASMVRMEMGSKNARVLKLKELIEAERFQALVIKELLKIFLESPMLDAKTASEVLKNFVSLHKHAEELEGLTAESCLDIVNFVNRMTYENTSAVRTMMKSTNLVALRDSLVLYLLQSTDVSSSALADTVVHFAFNTVAEEPVFREQHGLLYLVKHLLQTADNRGLQMQLLTILKMHFWVVDENRKGALPVFCCSCVLRLTLVVFSLPSPSPSLVPPSLFCAVLYVFSFPPHSNPEARG